MKILTKEQIILLHKQLIERYGGSHGIRDEGLLESAIMSRIVLFFHPTAYLRQIDFGVLRNSPH